MVEKLELDPEKGPIWEQQEGENAKAYRLFSLYRDYGPNRSVPAIFKKYNNTEFKYESHRGLQESYSSPCRWRERAAAYDAYILEEERKENEKLIREFNRERMQEALDLMNKSFAGMTKDIEEGNMQPRENRERYKMAFEMFRTLNNLDKESKIEHSGTVKIVFGDELEDV